jgi:hypothetical protein
VSFTDSIVSTALETIGRLCCKLADEQLELLDDGEGEPDSDEEVELSSLIFSASVGGLPVADASSMFAAVTTSVPGPLRS